MTNLSLIKSLFAFPAAIICIVLSPQLFAQTQIVDSTIAQSLLIKEDTQVKKEFIQLTIDGHTYDISNLLGADSGGVSLLKKGLLATPGGYAAKKSWKAIELTNTVTVPELQKLMVKRGFTESFSVSAASKILAKAKSIPGKGALVALAAGGTSWAVLEMASPFMPLWQKGVVVSIVILLAIGVYSIFRKKGVLS